MQEPETWRELLKEIISDPHYRELLAEEMGVRSITLQRWVNAESDPRPQNLRNLLTALPKYREQMLDLIREEPGFEDFSVAELDDASKEIPPTFYTNIFASRASAVENMRFWSICKMILQQAMGQLDPERLGMGIIVVRCMPPSQPDNKVHSLRESIGIGTYPWPADLEQRAMFLGAESLCGYVVSTGRPASTPNVDEPSLIPAHKVEYEKSAAVHPILYAGRIAGCLLVSSTQYNYFSAQSRVTLIEHYANLLALAFEPEEFYDQDQIQLFMMPNQSIQKAYFADFRQRVANTMLEAAVRRKPVNSVQAEQIVWQELEQQLFQVAEQESSR